VTADGQGRDKRNALYRTPDGRRKNSLHQIERERDASFIINRDCGRDALAAFKGGCREVRRKGRRLATR
jgi:hypothetical protein